MGKLVFAMTQSLDGYVASVAGELVLPPPGAALFRHFCDHDRGWPEFCTAVAYTR